MQKYRQSNFELLRILCMFGVLTNHVIQNCYPSLHSGNFTIQNELRILLMNVSIVAVNCFVMISGYFRIKQSVRSFLTLYFQLMFYCGILAIVGILLGHETFVMGCLKTIFPFTHGGMWFMTAYFALFLIAPILNAGYEALNKPHRCIMLGCLILVDMYIGYMHQCREVTQDGYHVIHFVAMYYVGMFLSDFRSYERLNWGGGMGTCCCLDDRLACA